MSTQTTSVTVSETMHECIRRFVESRDKYQQMADAENQLLQNLVAELYQQQTGDEISADQLAYDPHNRVIMHTSQEDCHADDSTQEA